MMVQKGRQTGRKYDRAGGLTNTAITPKCSRSLIYDDTTRRAFLGIRRKTLPVRATALRLSIMNLMACFRRAVMRGALA